jgi:hypothetical protein
MTSSYKNASGEVEFGSMSEYSYSGNNIDEAVMSFWDKASEAWELSQKSVYEYTGQLVSKITEYGWNTTISDWELFMENSLTYDGEDREIESLTRFWNPSESQFINHEKTTTEYYEGNKVSKVDSRQWDPVTEQWSEDNYTLSEYQYDSNGNEIEFVYTSAFGFGGFSILTKTKGTYEYDSNNFLILTTSFMWDEITSTWLNQSKTEYTNNAEGLPVEDIEYTYTGTDWENYEKHIYNYEGAVDVAKFSEIPSEFVLMQNYPNPFNPVTTIEYSLNKTDNVELIIYDILGNSLITLVNKVQNPGKYYVKFDAANYSSGTYIYKLKSGDNIITKKCLLIK